MAERKSARDPAAQMAGRELDLQRLMTADPSRSVDRFLKLSGLALAVVCALLPLAAHMQYTRNARLAAAGPGKTIRDPLDRSGQKTVMPKVANAGPGADLTAPGIDPATTGTATQDDAAGGQGKPEDPARQPFPPKPRFLLRDVVGGMGMIEDQTGFWFVEKGSLLPDSSRVADIAERDGIWQITTDKGGVIRQTP